MFRLSYEVLARLSFPLTLIEVCSSTPTSLKEEGLSFTQAENNHLNHPKVHHRWHNNPPDGITTLDR
jgi:hypothetical protein